MPFWLFRRRGFARLLCNRSPATAEGYAIVRCLFGFASILGLAASVGAQDVPPPVSYPPEFMCARATQKDNAIVVTFWVQQQWVKVRKYERVKDGKKETGFETYHGFSWKQIDLNLADDRIGIFGVNGKKMDPKDLLKRLAKPERVAVFRDYEQLDPFYLALLRDEVVVFKVAREKLRPRPEE